MSDIVERLRRFAWVFTDSSLERGLATEAAVEIERLRAALAAARNDALEEARIAALGAVIEINGNAGEPRYCGAENGGSWAVPQPKAGFNGSDYGTGRYDAAHAIRALKGGDA